MKRIYLACPYSKIKDKDDIAERVSKMANLIYNTFDCCIFSPISMSHLMVKDCKTTPTSFDHWMQNDNSFIKYWTTDLWIAAFDGWSDSVGCYQEARYANSYLIPIQVVSPDLTQFLPLSFRDFSFYKGDLP